MSPTRLSFSSATSQLEVRIISANLVVTRMTGRLDAGVAAALIEALDEWMSLGGRRLEAFHDWYGIEDYDSEARVLLTPWSVQHRAAFKSVNVLVRGRAVAWGLSIVNALIGGLISTHHDRRTFEEALDRSPAHPPSPVGGEMRVSSDRP